MTLEDRKVNLVSKVKGKDIIGMKLNAPLSPYEFVYAWPMLSIKMNKGTGVVTSVPSDSPDDYANLVDIKKKKAYREKYSLTDEMVLPFEPVSIIEIPEYSKLSAEKAYKQFKVQSMNDSVKLQQAKEFVYLKGHYKGVMLEGAFKGKTVEEAKILTR